MFVTRCWWEKKRREGNYGVRNWHSKVGTDREGVGQCLLRGIGALEEGRGGKRREEKRRELWSE